MSTVIIHIHECIEHSKIWYKIFKMNGFWYITYRGIQTPNLGIRHCPGCGKSTKQLDEDLEPKEKESESYNLIPFMRLPNEYDDNIGHKIFDRMQVIANIFIEYYENNSAIGDTIMDGLKDTILKLNGHCTCQHTAYEHTDLSGPCNGVLEDQSTPCDCQSFEKEP